MSTRARWLLIAVVAILALGGTATAGFAAWQQYAQRQAGSGSADAVPAADVLGADRIVFRSTESGAGYGMVSSVPLSAPDGPRAVSAVPCDRVDATDTALSCLRIVRGITPTYTATVVDAQGAKHGEWPLPGIPSRTRISPDGTLIATTAFVTGHSYATIGFSTDTAIHRTDGADVGGSLEDWTLTIDGQVTAPLDRNYWGITFVDDDTFYATVGMTTQGTTYLVRGSISQRTMTALAENVECPSLSPDGKRIAFKRATDGQGPSVHWTPAVYDVATGSVTLLPESRSIDDQIEWLDDGTILYGMPREGAAGDYDVWSLPADGSAQPAVFIEHAWSPAVVRGGDGG